MSIHGHRYGPLLVDLWRESDRDSAWTSLTFTLTIGSRSWSVTFDASRAMSHMRDTSGASVSHMRQSDDGVQPYDPWTVR